MDSDVSINEDSLAGFVNKIHRGDSRCLLKQLPSNSIDIVLTSPPYNYGINYDRYDDNLDKDEYLSNLFSVLDQCIRILKHSGRIIINIQPMFSKYLPTHHVLSSYLMEKGLIWKGEIIWEKNNYSCGYTCWGSWKSPSNPYLKYTWEFLEVFCKGSPKKNGSKSNIDISADEFKEWVIPRWVIKPENRMKEFGHPAVYPETLVERILKLFSYKGDVVLDPFNGVGTTCVVAKRLGRRFIGIDTSVKYCQIARKRAEKVPKPVSEFICRDIS